MVYCMSETNEKATKTNNINNTKRKKWISDHQMENIKSFAVAIILVLIIRSSIVEAFKIPSGSMLPTLMVGDHIFVNKFAYGLKIPFSDVILDKPIYVYERDIPARGDVIVFKFPKDESFYYIKRVVGRPGDRIRIKDKIIYLNDKPIERVSIKRPDLIDALDKRDYDVTALELFDEKYPLREDGKHFVMVDKYSYVMDNMAEVTVPPDHLFVMGDNRDYSNDSRIWGFVPMKNVKGKAMVIWLSMWLDFGEGKYYFRPTRLGTIIK